MENEHSFCGHIDGFMITRSSRVMNSETVSHGTCEKVSLRTLKERIFYLPSSQEKYANFCGISSRG